MRHLRPYNLFEKTLLEAEESLKQFQHQSNITTDVDDLLTAIAATQISIKTLLPFATDEMTLPNLFDHAGFAKELTERGLKAGEQYNTEDDSTFVRLPLRYTLIYTKGSSDLDTPIYLLLQYLDHKWTKVQLYYVQKDIKHFYDCLSTVVMTITKKDNADKSWVYKTSNSGRNWELENKKAATSTFTPHLTWEQVQGLKKHSKIEVIFN